MELKEFIKATITAIAESIDELNGELEGKAVVNPKSVDLVNKHAHNDSLIYVLRYGAHDNIADGRLIKEVEFNLVVSDAVKTKKGVSLNVNIASAGIANTKGGENVNTVKFSIPVAFMK